MDPNGSGGQGPPPKRRRTRPTLSQQNATLKEQMEELMVERDALARELGKVKEALGKCQAENDVVQVTSDKVENLYSQVSLQTTLPIVTSQLEVLIEQGHVLTAQMGDRLTPPRLQLLASMKLLQVQLARKERQRQQLLDQITEKDDTIDALRQTFASDYGAERNRRLELEQTLHTLHNSMENMLLCSVCLCQWDCTGEHRVVSLPCGHVYGESCISNCLQQFGCCPQCRQPCTLDGMRRLYVNLSD